MAFSRVSLMLSQWNTPTVPTRATQEIVGPGLKNSLGYTWRAIHRRAVTCWAWRVVCIFARWQSRVDHTPLRKVFTEVCDARYAGMSLIVERKFLVTGVKQSKEGELPQKGDYRSVSMLSGKRTSVDISVD